MRIPETKTALALLLVGLVSVVCGFAWAAEEEPDAEMIGMIAEFINAEDHDTRALGFQQVREGIPGEAATKQFAAMVEKLAPDAQAGLIEALGDRKDPAASPTILKALDSKEEIVRCAALKALGSLGTAADVPLLAAKTAGDSDAEKDAARGSLVRMRDDGANKAIVAAMAEAEPPVRVALLGVLAARNARESLPEVLKSVKDEDAEVRSAALGALRFLADEKNAAAIAELLKAAEDDNERGKAELALLSVCSRSGEAAAEPIIAAMKDADMASRVTLLRTLARASGQKSLDAIVARLEDYTPAVKNEAVRMLAGWPDAAAVPHLLKIAKDGKSERHQILAIRGLVRLAGPLGDKPADMKTLAELAKVAKRPEEKCLVLGVLSGVGTSESLALVTPSLDDPALAEEAALATVMIAEIIKDGDKSKIKAAVEKAGKKAKDKKVRDRAAKLLKSL